MISSKRLLAAALTGISFTGVVNADTDNILCFVILLKNANGAMLTFCSIGIFSSCILDST